jgi:hypothetical protein
MNRTYDNRDLGEIERTLRAEVEALRRALAERDMLIDALRQDVIEMERAK